VPLPIEPTAGAAGEAARADDQRGDDAARIEWITAVGRLADRERPAWEPGKPAACDAPALHAVRVAVARFLRDEGHLAIAPVVERRATVRAGRAGAGAKSDFDAAIRTTDAGTDRGDLVAEIEPSDRCRCRFTVDIRITQATSKQRGQRRDQHPSCRKPHGSSTTATGRELPNV
jgi:hypothetical protein